MVKKSCKIFCTWPSNWIETHLDALYGGYQEPIRPEKSLFRRLPVTLSPSMCGFFFTNWQIKRNLSNTTQNGKPYGMWGNKSHGFTDKHFWLLDFWDWFWTAPLGYMAQGLFCFMILWWKEVLKWPRYSRFFCFRWSLLWLSGFAKSMLLWPISVAIPLPERSRLRSISPTNPLGPSLHGNGPLGMIMQPAPRKILLIFTMIRESIQLLSL